MKDLLLGLLQAVLMVIFIVGCWQMIKCVGCTSATEFIWNMMPRIAGTWLCGHYFCVIEERTNWNGKNRND